jgi:hypothetical protein
LLKNTLKRALKLAIGWMFIVLGILGLFLPVLQGILFLLIGLMIISTEYVWARRLLDKLKARFPKIAEQSQRGHMKVEAWFHRHFQRDKKHSPHAAPHPPEPDQAPQ